MLNNLRRLHWRGSLFATALLVAASGTAAQPDAPAEFSVTDTVIASDVEPIGVNMTTITGGTNLATNNLIRGGGMEPAVARYLIRIERNGPDWIEWDQSKGGVHMWDQNATGFGDGADVRLYRIVDDAGQPLSYAGGTDLADNTGADHVVRLGDTRVDRWIAEGSDGATNRVYFEDAIDLAYGDHALITVTKRRLNASEVHPRLHQWFEPQANILGNLDRYDNLVAQLVTHPGTLPPAFTEPGETCLEVEVPDPRSVRLGQYLFHGYDDGEGQWYTQLLPGAAYRATVWLRQEGLPDGHVRFIGVGPYSGLTQDAPWQVTGDWQQFTYEFTGPDYPSPDQYHGGFGIQIDGPGKVWIDNFVVYRNDAAHDFRPFTPHRTAFDELMAALPEAGLKPATRFYDTTYPGFSPVQRILSNYPSSHLNFIYNVQPAGQAVTIPQVLEWSLATGDSPLERTPPYITLSEEYVEEDWLAVVEFLGVPYDPDSDTPATKPWAYLRYQQRGHGRPWTDEFREIVIEFGNETWHAGVFAGWDGFGRPGWVHHGGLEYGLFARYYFTEQVAAHPWWSQYGLDAKIRFSLNANYDADPERSYGEIAAQAAPDATDYLGHANYVGPKWETGDTPFESFDDHGVQETLVGAYLGMFPLISEVAATRDALDDAGLADYRPVAYEGGPSGYYLPGSGDDEQVAISQLYGKSLGMGVSALDAWLYSSANGYGHQFMYAFHSGANWSSHTMPRAGGFRRHTGWLAFMLRNRYAPGREMLEVRTDSVPTYQREGEDVPLMSAYAMRGPDALSIFVLSRKLDGVHDGADFGDGSTPVRISLEPTACATLTRHALTTPAGTPADPRASNLEAENIVISSLPIAPDALADGELTIDPTTGGVAGGMPPGTVYLYTCQTRLDDACDRNGDGAFGWRDSLDWWGDCREGTIDGCDRNGDGAFGFADVRAFARDCRGR